MASSLCGPLGSVATQKFSSVVCSLHMLFPNFLDTSVRKTVNYVTHHFCIRKVDYTDHNKHEHDTLL